MNPPCHVALSSRSAAPRFLDSAPGVIQGEDAAPHSGRGGQSGERRVSLSHGSANLKRRWRRVALYGLALMVLSVATTPSTLCISPDGRMAIEASLAGHSATTVDAVASAVPAVSSPASRCCCCGCTHTETDLSLRASDPAAKMPPPLVAVIPILHSADRHAPSSAAWPAVARALASAPIPTLRITSAIRC
jgi:hypothetical protein